MKYLPLVLLLSACATAWPKRGPDYWANFVEENKPYSTESADFFPSGAVERTVVVDADTAFHFKFIQAVNRAPIWVMDVGTDRKGYFIFQERMQDGSVIRARDRKIEFTLTEAEYAKVRTAIVDSGFLSIRSNFGGSEEPHWNVGVATSEGIKLVEFNGGYPAEARNIVYGVYDVVVRPRSAQMADAPEFKPEDWTTAPEYQPLR